MSESVSKDRIRGGFNVLSVSPFFYNKQMFVKNNNNKATTNADFSIYDFVRTFIFENLLKIKKVNKSKKEIN